MHRVALLLFLLATPAVAADCPCLLMPTFARAVTVPAMACTNQPKGRWGEFVRVLTVEYEIAAAFALGPQLYCGWQGNDYRGGAILQPLGSSEYRACRQLLLAAAHASHVHCVPEFP